MNAKRILHSILLLACLGGCSSGSNDPTPITEQPQSTVNPTQAPSSSRPTTQLITWDVQAELPGYLNITGSFTYDRVTLPYEINCKHLVGNVCYTLVSWILYVHQGIHEPYDIILSNTEPFNTASICLGICRFSHESLEQVLVTNGKQTVQLVWHMPIPLTQLTETLDEWGTVAPGYAEIASYTATGQFEYSIQIVNINLTLHITE